MNLRERCLLWRWLDGVPHAGWLEEAARDGAAKKAYLAWSDTWNEVDKDLARLAQEDHDAYSEMMMDREVVFEGVTKEQAEQVLRALEAVTLSMKAEMDRGDADPDYLESIRLERRELRGKSTKLKKALER